MRLLIPLFFLVSCTASQSVTDENNPGSSTGDAGLPDVGPMPNPMGKPAGAACTTGSDCKGGTCLGAPGQPEEGNNRFAGGYCTAVGCTPESQEGCGADEWCVDGGGSLGGYCVELCSKSEGLVCDRADHGCMGLGTFGGCYSLATVECNPRTRMGCPAADICVKIGFEDHTLGRCETTCDPMEPKCPNGGACYYIKSYNAAFCGQPGPTVAEESCSCDKCCQPGLACTPDTDGSGRHCKTYCVVATGEGCAEGETCEPLKVNDDGDPISPWGGCVAPGSAGTPTP